MENNTPKKDIFDLTEEEFAEYFEVNIRPKTSGIIRFMKILDEIFLKGKRNGEPGCIIFLWCIPLAIWTLLVSDSLPLPAWLNSKFVYMQENYYTFWIIFTLFFFLGSFTWLFLVLWPYLIKVVFDKPTKKVIFKEMGLEYYNGLFYYSDFEHIAKYFAKIFFRVDEMLRGKYKGRKFVIIDCAEKGAERKIFIATKIERKFSAQTLIGTKSALNMPFFKGEKVNLESVEFSKVYDIFGDDQVESRYILTPSFMERLLKYNQKNAGNIQVFLSDKLSPDYNIFFSVPVNKNWFELPNNSNIFSFAKFIKSGWFYGFLTDIKEIMQVIDALKLDQDIGM